MHWRGKHAIPKMHACVSWYFVSPGYSRTLATVLSSGKNTTTDRMRACMKILKTQFLLRHDVGDGTDMAAESGVLGLQSRVLSFQPMQGKLLLGHFYFLQVGVSLRLEFGADM